MNNKIQHLPIKNKEKNKQLKLQKLIKIQNMRSKSKVLIRKDYNRFNILSDNKSQDKQCNYEFEVIKLKEVVLTYLNWLYYKEHRNFKVE